MATKQIPLHKFHPPESSTIPFDLIRLEHVPKIATSPHPNRHTFYSLFWVTQGAGKHVIDFTEYDIRPNSLFFMGRGLVHYWDLTAPLAGYVILFEADLFHIMGENSFLTEIDLFQAAFHRSVIYPQAEESQWIHSIIEQLEAEYTHHQFGQRQMIIALLQQLLIQAQRLTLSSKPLEPKGQANVELTQRFLKLVEQAARTHHKVGDYADLMGISIGHLSSCVKEVLGITAGEALRQQLILEAKRQLIHTHLSIAEVAHALNFTDPSYFGRFFKRETGQTPREFRLDFATKVQMH